MDLLTRSIAVTSLMVFLAACGGGGGGNNEETVTVGWPKPACDHPEGDWNVAFSADGGASVQYPLDARPARYEYSPGVVVLQEPGSIIASHSDDGYSVFTISRDAGCHWEVLGEVEDMFFPVLAEGDGNIVYAWDWYSDKLVVINPAADPGEVLDMRQFSSLGAQVKGFASSATDPEHVAYFDSSGFVRYSTDGGRTWPRELSRAVPRLSTSGSNLFYNAAFSREDLLHVTIGTIGYGLQSSFDGGETWEASVISSVSSGNINCFDVKFMPGSDDVAWALCIDIDEAVGGADTRGRHLYRSMDGGQSFEVLVDSAPDKSMSNGTVFLPVPGRPDEVYYEFFSCFNVSPDGEGSGGTDIYHFDAGTGEITEYWHPEMTGLDSAAFHPDDPQFIYLGLDQDPSC